MRPHLDYGDIIYDLPNNESFTQKFERFQYKAALAITGAIKETSQSKLYSELGFESLKFRRSFRKLCSFSELKTSGLPEYLFDLFHKTIICTTLVFWKMLQHFIVEPMLLSTLFSIYNIRMEQSGEEDKTIFNSADFQKFPIKDWPTCT